MVQNGTFKRLEVSGLTKDEAVGRAPFRIIKDATFAYKLWRNGYPNGVTESDKKKFMLDYLEKWTKNAPGLGCSITLNSAIADTRDCPCKIIDVKNTDGSRKWEKTFRFIDEFTGDDVTPKTNKPIRNKVQARAIVRDLYRNGFTHNICASYDKYVAKGQPVAFRAEYTPSKNAQIGNYVVFGIEGGN